MGQTQRIMSLIFSLLLTTHSFAQDTEEPKLIEWNISTSEVDVSVADATVQVEFRITDNDSGTKTPTLIARSTTTDQSSAGFASVTLVSGDRKDGIWRASITIPKGSASGIWEVRLYPLEDNQGNRGSFGPPSSFDNEFVVAQSGGNSNVDSDGDGVNDDVDAFPLDNTESKDSDGDGVGDNSDKFPDDSSEALDTDLDGTGNNADEDDDGDGLVDSADAFPLDASETLDTDGDGTGNNADTDDDGDGVADSADAFPLDASETLDTDSNGVGNNADLDDDGDGLADGADAYPLVAIGSLVDTDNDGAPDACDHECVVAGMVADTDDDNDGLIDKLDSDPLDATLPFHSGLLATSASSATVLVNSVYRAGSRFSFGVTNTSVFPLSITRFLATNGDETAVAETLDPAQLGEDGVLASSESLAINLTLNSSARPPITLRYEYLNPLNNKSEFIEISFSATGSVVTKSDPQDTDDDGEDNTVDTDDDNDGVEDSADAFPLDPAETLDTDADGTGNNADLDDDNDGYSDAYELETGTDPLDATDFKPPYDDLNGVVYHWSQHSLVNAAEISRIADAEVKTATNTQGQYTFEETPEGSYELSASKAIAGSDTNRTITSADALAALKIAVGLNPNSDPDGDGPLEALAVSPYQLIAADMNQDGRVTSADALAILKVAVGLSDALAPSWTLVEDSQALWSTHSDKSKVFDASQSYALSYPDQTQVNFAAILVGDVNASWKPQEGTETLSHDHFSTYAKVSGAPLSLWGIRDSDNDGLSDEQEEVLGTSPFNADTDADGVNDIDDAYPLDPDKSEDVAAGFQADRLLSAAPKRSDVNLITLVNPVLLRGDMNDWGVGDVFTKLEDGSYYLALNLGAGTYTFKIATDDWAVMDLGAKNEESRLIVRDRPVQLIADSNASFVLEVNDGSELVFVVEYDSNGTAVLRVNELQ